MARLRRSLLALAAAAASVAVVAVPNATPAGGNTIVTAAGSGTRGSGGDGWQASEAQLNQPRSIFPTPDGGFVWAEPYANDVRKVGPDGVVTVVAGTGAAGFSGDGGPATRATLNFVHAAVPTSDGGYLIADLGNDRIRKVSASGVITTVAGIGVHSYWGDNGRATDAAINRPHGVAPLPDGSFLIVDTDNQRIRKVDVNGIITTVAGTGVQGFSGDRGRATSAELSSPFGVVPTADGGLLIVDTGNQRIRKVSPDGIITTVAGNGRAGFSGDGGPAATASLNTPHNVFALPDGGFLIADTGNNRIRRVAANGIIQTIAGNGKRGFSGDGGNALKAELSVPKAVSVTPAGDILVADEGNDRIRFMGTPLAPRKLSAPTVSGSVARGRALTADPGKWRGTGPIFRYEWQRCARAGRCVAIRGATTKRYAVTGADGGSTLRVKVTGANVAGSGSGTSARTQVVPGPRTEAPLVITVGLVPIRPKAGSSFRAFVRVSADGRPVMPTNVKCPGTIESATVTAIPRASLGIATCVFRPSQAARGKVMNGGVSFTARGAKVYRRFAIVLG